MISVQPQVIFALDEVHATTTQILQARPDPVPAYRLLNEVLRLPANDVELRKARSNIERSQWVQQLYGAQLLDGSWGRFHSQDTKIKAVFRTTEEAIDRAFSLGLDQTQPVLNQAKNYIVNVLRGQAHITDRDEKSESWPLLIWFILSGRLAQIDPTEPILTDGWECLAEVTRRAFASGQYCLKDEAEAFEQVKKTHVPKGFLESQHALWILSSRPLPENLERQLIKWVWNKQDGIRYLRAPLFNPMPGAIVYWLRSMNILSRFTSWREVSAPVLNDLWQQRNQQGMWDFGKQTSWCVDFPISENWRKGIDRQVDYSTCILALFRKYLD